MGKNYKIEKLVRSLRKKHRKLWIISLFSILLLSFMMTQNCGREEEDSNVIPDIPGSGGVPLPGGNNNPSCGTGGASFGEVDLTAESYFEGTSRGTAKIIVRLEVDLQGNPQDIPRGANEKRGVCVRVNLDVKEGNSCGFSTGNFSVGEHGVEIALGNPDGSDNANERPILRAYLDSFRFESRDASLSSSQGSDHILYRKQDGVYTMSGLFSMTVGGKSCSRSYFDPNYSY